MAQAGIVHRPGMAKDLLAQLAPLLAADGIDLDNLGGAYRRMCGAGHADTPSVVAAVGLPPHARRRQGPAEARLEAEGPTAACAAPGGLVHMIVCPPWAYRRMRRAGAPLVNAGVAGVGLPPHARRRRQRSGPRGRSRGPTAACAAPASCHGVCCGTAGAYRRMRGAGARGIAVRIRLEGLPPHARRRQLVDYGLCPWIERFLFSSEAARRMALPDQTIPTSFRAERCSLDAA